MGALLSGCESFGRSQCGELAPRVPRGTRGASPPHLIHSQLLSGSSADERHPLQQFFRFRRARSRRLRTRIRGARRGATPAVLSHEQFGGPRRQSAPATASVCIQNRDSTEDQGFPSNAGQEHGSVDRSVSGPGSKRFASRSRTVVGPLAGNSSLPLTAPQKSARSFAEFLSIQHRRTHTPQNVVALSVVNQNDLNRQRCRVTSTTRGFGPKRSFQRRLRKPAAFG